MIKRKKFLVFALLLSVSGFYGTFAYADSVADLYGRQTAAGDAGTDVDSNPAETGKPSDVVNLAPAEETKRPEPLEVKPEGVIEPKSTLVGSDALIDLNYTKQRLDRLERRLDDLERDHHDLEDRLRALDRSIDDLQRRR